MQYFEFCEKNLAPLSDEEMASTEETAASPEDIQNWKGLKVRLAVRHFKKGDATPAELDLLINKRPKTKVTNPIYQRAIQKEH